MVSAFSKSFLLAPNMAESITWQESMYEKQQNWAELILLLANHSCDC
jgi:hypothetical protein